MAGKQFKLVRKDGSISWYKNSWLIAAYYFIPKSILDKCGSLPQKIFRFPYHVLRNWDQIALIESDSFTELVVDAFHYMIWPYMNMKAGCEVYSGYHPAWIFSYFTPVWIDALEKAEVIPTVRYLYDYYSLFEYVGYVDEAYIDSVLKSLVPKVMEENGMNAIIEVTKQYPCFEDFDERRSKQKTSFLRQWYHWRTKHPETSLEAYLGKYDKKTGEYARDLEDKSIDIDEYAVSEVQVEDFLHSLSMTDRKILTLRMEGNTYERIAELLGYQTHSAVIKRIRKIGEAYQKYAGVDIGYD